MASAVRPNGSFQDQALQVPSHGLAAADQVDSAWCLCREVRHVLQFNGTLARCAPLAIPIRHGCWSSQGVQGSKGCSQCMEGKSLSLVQTALFNCSQPFVNLSVLVIRELSLERFQASRVQGNSVVAIGGV